MAGDRCRHAVVAVGCCWGALLVPVLGMAIGQRSAILQRHDLGHGREQDGSGRP